MFHLCPLSVYFVPFYGVTPGKTLLGFVQGGLLMVETGEAHGAFIAGEGYAKNPGKK